MREDTFRALNPHPPGDWKVVIFGQDPYPRASSACGIAFYDAAIKSWSDPLSPSFRNIIKNVQIHLGKMKPSDKVDVLRKVLTKGFPDPPHWFEGTMAEGVLWLNTALTFTTTDRVDTNRHTAFWKPIISAIIERLLAARGDKGLVFVLWGGYAAKLKPLIHKINDKLDRKVPIRFVDAKHPMNESFHSNNSFAEIDAALAELKIAPINWTASVDPASSRAPSGGTSDNGKKAGGKRPHVDATAEPRESSESDARKKRAKSA